MTICMAKIEKVFFPADFADAADFVADKILFCVYLRNLRSVHTIRLRAKFSSIIV